MRSALNVAVITPDNPTEVVLDLDYRISDEFYSASIDL